MSADEFVRQHKRLFVTLEAYGFLKANSQVDLWFIRHGTPVVWFDASWRDHKPFAIGGGGFRTRYYTRESSVLAALAKIHAGQTP